MYLLRFIQLVFVHAVWEQWVLIGILSLVLTLFFLIHKKSSVYCAVCLGLAIFTGLFLLDTAVLIRIGDDGMHTTGFDIAAEFYRFLYGGMVRWTEMFANLVAFVPFGFFLLEFLTTNKQLNVRCRISFVTFCAFGLSLCIESFQLILRVGAFEVTDLVLNTLGGFLGAWVSVILRKVFGVNKKGGLREYSE